MAGRVPARLTPGEGRRFGVTVGGAFAVLAGIAWWRGQPTAALVLAIPAGLLILAGLAVPGRLGGVHAAWMRMALAISKVTTPIIMGVIYYLVLTPTGLLRRALSRNPLVHESRNDSYFVSRAPGATRRSDLERQF